MHEDNCMTRREMLGLCASTIALATTSDGAETTVAYAPLALDWPKEMARRADHQDPTFLHRMTNIVLDFHGDPLAAKLVVFSDGNHHMALEESLQTFLARHPDIVDVFYTTTPPRVPVEILQFGCIHVGNLTLSVRPQVFISPPNVLDELAAKGLVRNQRSFMRSRGNVLLVAKGNPKRIHELSDVARDDVRLFISNPKTEAASFEVYAETLEKMARQRGLNFDFLKSDGGDRSGKVVYSELIHHRELPQAVANGRCDVAIVYYHLALRYTRIFPDRFEIVFLDRDLATQPASPENIISRYNISLVGNGGIWGAPLVKFMMSTTVTQIYERHGLARP
ncbi:conserved hypothetical protein [Gammaproteobacteria bacterium]